MGRIEPVPVFVTSKPNTPQLTAFDSYMTPQVSTTKVV